MWNIIKSLFSSASPSTPQQSSPLPSSSPGISVTRPTPIAAPTTAVVVLPISQEAETLIINEETGGQAYYEKTETHPDWPGGMSGVTIGCGYDCGYATEADIASDWGTLLPADALAALQSVAGIHGSPAHSHAAELHWIAVPWKAAMAVFLKKDVPKWTLICQRDLPNFSALKLTCRGVIVSLAFNRGPSFNDAGDRYVEMRSIKANIIAGRFDLIPGNIIRMQRLWPVNGDLWNRRAHEAALFQKGLQETT